MIRDHTSILEPLKRSRVSNVIIAHDKPCTSRLGGREKISRARGREGRREGRKESHSDHSSSTVKAVMCV